MEPSFEKVDDDERRFKPIDLPRFEHTLTREQLSKVDEITGERWKLDNVLGQKMDWVIQHLVIVSENIALMEIELIRSRKFRQWMWVRMTLVAALLICLAKYLGWL